MVFGKTNAHQYALTTGMECRLELVRLLADERLASPPSAPARSIDDVRRWSTPQQPELGRRAELAGY